MKDYFVLKNMSSSEAIPLISSSVTLGRGPECEIVVDCSEASRQHAKITRRDGRLTIEDLGSTNGTTLNGQQLRKPEIIGGGDIIYIGQVYYLVVDSGASDQGTIVGGRLAAIDENYVVDQFDPNVTGLRMSYPKPPGWSEDETPVDSKQTNSKLLGVLVDQLRQQSVGADKNAAVFMIVSQSGRNTLLPLPAGKSTWDLGRATSNDLEVSDITISSVHARVNLQSNTWHVEDLNSTNGTRINGEKIDRGVLTDGDTLRLGKVDLLFKSLSPGETF
ncbi:FHA domain-containing protein [Candidatus Seongchinamella marina]|jgi:pSer/pThr/pTyr-binding forkhead associated (FHA) protein|nr:FHA domain-containing protein [Candidatus Seongchinamella marina]